MNRTKDSPGELPQARLKLGVRLGMNHTQNRFRLSKINPAREKGTQRKFTRPSEPGAM